MAATTLGKLKEGIREKLSILTVRVKLETAVGHMDINHEAEDFYCGLLNTAFGWKLSNLNELKMNFPAIDLGDRENRIAVQVTSTEGRKKIQDTLDRFFEKELNKDYDRLIVLIIGEKPNYRGAFALDGDLNFDKDQDIWDTALLTQKLDALTQSRLMEVDSYLGEQLPEHRRQSAAYESPEVIAALSGIQKAVETMAAKPEVQPVINVSQSITNHNERSSRKSGKQDDQQENGRKKGWMLILTACIATLLIGGIVSLRLHSHRRYHDGMLMRNAFENAEQEQEEYAFNTQAKRSEVATITFLNYVDPEVENTADASAMQNGSVRAWAVPNGNYYDLYIAADGGVYAPEDSSGLFREMINLSAIHFNDAFHISRVENMSGMFYNCKNLRKLDLSDFHTDNVTDMSFLFGGCGSLEQLDVSGLDTSNVTDMSAMFYNMSRLRELDISSLDTRKVTDMGYMLCGCKMLTQLQLSGLQTSRVRNMERMFASCESLTALDLSSFDTENVTSMCAMFYQTKNLLKIDLSSFHTAQVTDMGYMFSGCEALKQLDVTGFDTAKVMNMEHMFSRCLSLTELDLSSFDTSNVTRMYAMFFRNEQLRALNLEHFDTGNVTDMSHMFQQCRNLSNLDLRNFDTAQVTSMKCMFNNCVWLGELDLRSFNTRKVTDMSYMFSECLALNLVDLSSFSTSRVTNMSYMFNSCMFLSELDLRGFDTANVTDMSNMFASCVLLGDVGAGEWNLSSVMVHDNFMDDGKTVNGRPWEELFQ